MSQPEIIRVSRPMMITLVLILSLLILFALITGGIVLNYALMVHYVHAISLHVESVDKTATRQILAAKAKAQQGRSRSLCRALKQMGSTHAAHRLHPVFVRVYQSSGCSKVTGKLNLSSWKHS